MTGRIVGFLLVGVLVGSAQVLPAQSMGFLDRSGRDTVAIELVDVTPIQIRGVLLERNAEGKRETRYTIGIGPNGGMTRIDLTVMTWNPATNEASLPLRITARTVADTMRVERQQGDERIMRAHAVAGRPTVPVIVGSRVSRLMLGRILANDSIAAVLVVETAPAVAVAATPVRRSTDGPRLTLGGEVVVIPRSGSAARLAGQSAAPPPPAAIRAWWSR